MKLQRLSRSLAAALALLALAFPAMADAPANPVARVCQNRGEILKALKQKYGEVPRAVGLSSSGVLIEVIVAPGGSFTIVVTDPQQQTCVVAVGESFEILTEGDPT